MKPDQLTPATATLYTLAVLAGALFTNLFLWLVWVLIQPVSRS